MTKLYLVRHAEAEGNLYRRIHGQYDSDITENGYRQLEALKKRFADISIDCAYSSDLTRARKTAEAICEGKGLLVETRADLREVAMGVWEDRPWGEVEMKDPDHMRLFRESSKDWLVEGGESFEALQSRVYHALLEIAKKHPNQTVVVACHGTAIRFACAAFLGLSVEESHSLGHSDNTAVTLLEIEQGKAKIVFSDDNSHLSQEISTLARQTWWKEGNQVALDENLWFEPMDFSQFLYKGLYLAARQEAWTDLNRDMAYFGRQPYLEMAEECSKQNPNHLLCAMRRNTIVGILQLNPIRCVENNAGYIAFFYMLPEFRGDGLGVQMLGEAISIYRAMGRDRIHLSCGEENVRGMKFYERHGFRNIGTRQEPFGLLNRMEKYIGLE